MSTLTADPPTTSHAATPPALLSVPTWFCVRSGCFSPLERYFAVFTRTW